MNIRVTLSAFVATAAFAASGCAGTMSGGDSAMSPATANTAVAPLRTAAGMDVGSATISQDGADLRLKVEARNMPPGAHGAHIHMTGRCDAPDFTSAGGHWNPTGAQHGLKNPQGAHRGDLPNLMIDAGGTGRLTATIPGAMMRGSTGLLDADGAAFVVHAGPDDMMSDPAGNSGSRIACGVFAAAG